MKSFVEITQEAYGLVATAPMPSFRYGKGISVSLKDLDMENVVRDCQERGDDGVHIEAPREVNVFVLHDESCHPRYSTLVPPPENKLTALHYALLRRAHVIRIPKEAVVTQPVIVSSKPFDRSVAQHIVIIAEPHSQASIVIVDTSVDTVFRSQAIEVFAQEGAHVSIHGVQDLDYSKTHNFVWKRGEAEKDAAIHWRDLVLGSSFTQLHKHTNLVDEGATSTMQGVFLAARGQQFDIDDTVVHSVGQTISNIMSRGIISDTATTVYRGTIRVEKNARHCVGHQKSQNLLIGESARCNAVPILDIQNDDVTCSHGASFERISEEQLFYLLSRGLDETTAERTILLGLAEPLIAALPMEGLRLDIAERVKHKLAMKEAQHA